MIVKLLGLGDLVAGASLVFLNLGFKGAFVYVAIASALYLGLKGIMFFSTDFASFVDGLSVMVIVAVIFGFSSAWTYLFAVWLFQKGLRSLF